MIRKAIVPMAGLGTRLYPISVVLPKGLMPFVLPDGSLTTGLQLIAHALLDAGVEQIGVVVSPENRSVYEAFLAGGRERYAAVRATRPNLQQTYESLQRLRERIEWIEQRDLWGLGHAVWCARAFAEGEAVLVLLGDHLPIPLEPPDAITEVIALYARYQAPVYGVHRVPLGKVSLYGILQGAPIETQEVYRLLRLHEKPSPDYAQKHLHTEGLGADEFFAHSGVYAFPPALWEVLEQIAADYTPAHGEWTLTCAQQRLLERMPALLVETPPTLDFGTAHEYRRAFGYLAGYGDV
jgi:UTP--glucose-1-phosphate uridylyltransferase